MIIETPTEEEINRFADEAGMYWFAGSAEESNAKRTWRESILYWMGIPSKAERAAERAEREREARR